MMTDVLSEVRKSVVDVAKISNVTTEVAGALLETAGIASDDMSVVT